MIERNTPDAVHAVRAVMPRRDTPDDGLGVELCVCDDVMIPTPDGLRCHRLIDKGPHGHDGPRDRAAADAFARIETARDAVSAAVRALARVCLCDDTPDQSHTETARTIQYVLFQIQDRLAAEGTLIERLLP